MSAPAVQTMTGHLTLPFEQGASTLAITLKAGGDATQAQINGYDFSNYRARYGPMPKPSYVLVLQKDVAVLTQVTVDYRKRSDTNIKGSVSLTVPAGMLAGTSLVDWRLADGTSASDVLADPDIELITLRMSPAAPGDKVAPSGEAANSWSLVALLGNMAKLLWVISCEKDVIRRHIELVQTQRYLPQAVKYSLDMLGYDLGVPRLPPRPYSFDDDTLALYHLNDQFSGGQVFGSQVFGKQVFGNQGATVRDSMTDYAPPGYPGQGTDVASVTGRFDKAVAFRKSSAAISIPNNKAFDLDATKSFTLECLVKPDPPNKPEPDGEILAKFANGVGWSLSVGAFKRSISLNLRFLLGDGKLPPVELFADQSLPTNSFTLVVGVIDRQTNTAYLYIDGKVVTTQSIAGLGALTNTNAISIGTGSASGSAYQGVIEEVRFSRSARTTFSPVLGEADEAYRQRLALFAGWTLPTLPNLLDMLNRSVGSIKGVKDPNPLVLDDIDAPKVSGTFPLLIKPANPSKALPPITKAGSSSSTIVCPDRGMQLADGFVMQVGDTVTLGIQPKPEPQQSISWLVIAYSTGQANFTTPTNGPTVSLVPAKPGPLYIKVELKSGQDTVASTCTLHILPRPTDLPIGATISDDGTLGVTEDIAGEPDDFFHPVYLITHNNAGATYGNNVNNQRMQSSLAQLLNKLLTSLATSGIAGPLEVVQAYTPSAGSSSVANRLFQVGRAIVLQHPTLSGDRLAVLAHSVGFTYVCRQTDKQVLALQKPGELITITGLQETTEGVSISLNVAPQAAPLGIAASNNAVYTANSGTDTVSVIDPVTGKVRDAVKVGWEPSALVLSPDGKRLYTADSSGNTITAMDVDSATGNLTVVHTEPVSSNNPVALAHSTGSGAQRIYVVCQKDNMLLRIDTKSWNTSKLKVGASPTGIVLTPDGKEAWIALNGDKQIVIVSMNPFTLAGSITLGQAPLKIAIAPDGKRAYVTQPSNNSVVVLDVPGRKIAATVPIEYSPSGLAVAPDSSTIYVTSKDKQRIYLLQPDGTAGGSIGTAQTAEDVFALSSTRIYVVGSQSNMASAIDPQGKVVVSIWKLGTGLGEYLAWTLGLGPITRASLSNSTTPQVSLKAEYAGPAVLKASYVLPGNTPPYTFDVRLKDESNSPIIRKEQYDLIMNILNVFHPVGVEVTTKALRKYVIEVKGQFTNIVPDYTYPNFRLRGPLPH